MNKIRILSYNILHGGGMGILSRLPIKEATNQYSVSLQDTSVQSGESRLGRIALSCL
jgi:hypothetical protein